MTNSADAAVPPGRRERKRLQTRQHLVTAAMELFEQKGFDDVTVTEIADRADVDPSTFFRHFGSKEAVLFVDTDRMIDQVSQLFVPDADSRADSVLDVLYESMVTLLEEEGFDPSLEFIRARLQESSPEIHARTLVQNEKLVAAVADHIGELLDIDPNDDPVPHLVATMWVGAFVWHRMRALAEDRPVVDPLAVLSGVVEAIGRVAEVLQAPVARP